MRKNLNPEDLGDFLEQAKCVRISEHQPSQGIIAFSFERLKVDVAALV